MTVERTLVPEPPDVIWDRSFRRPRSLNGSEKAAVVDDVVDGERLVFTWQGDADDRYRR
jgi:hypothetical protein